MDRPNLDRQALLTAIQEDEQAELLSAGEDDIRILDLDFDKEINFHLIRYTPEALARRIHFGPSFAGDKGQAWALETARTLLRLPPEVFLTLNQILIPGTASDMEFFCRELDLEDEMMPEALFDEDDETGLTTDLVGQNWFFESSVVVNLHAIRVNTEEQWGDMPERIPRELEIGFWTTLFHELRHQQVDGFPYEADWLRNGDETEKAVEDWAIAQSERLIGVI